MCVMTLQVKAYAAFQQYAKHDIISYEPRLALELLGSKSFRKLVYSVYDMLGLLEKLAI